MAPPDKPPPLPLAPDRAAVSNRISLLLAAQFSVLKTMNHQSSSGGPARRQPPQHQQHKHHLPDEEELFREYSRPNEGVGYVADAAKIKQDDAAREDRMLRARLLGKQKADKMGRRGVRPADDDDDEDDEGGRSSLGKRKRPRRVAEPLPAADVGRTTAQDGASDPEERTRAGQQASGEGPGQQTEQIAEPAHPDSEDQPHLVTEAQTETNKKRRKKRKKKNHKEQGEQAAKDTSV